MAFVTFGIDIRPVAAKSWADGTGNWNVGANWSPASVPTAGEAVNIVFTDGVARTVTYNVAAPALGLLAIDLTGPGSAASTLSMPNNFNLTVSGIVVGGHNGVTVTAGRGAMTQAGGTTTTTAGWDFTVGYGAGSTGNYTLSGGALTANQSEYVGISGNGTFNHSGGTNTIATASGFFILGLNSGSTGTYNLSGTAALASNTNLRVGDNGAGIFNQTGGSISINSGKSLFLGNGVSGTGTYTLSTGNLFTGSAGVEHIGYNGKGTFNHSGGINSALGGLTLGSNTLTSNGTYALSGSGTLDSGGDEFLGNSGSGTFTQTAGTHTVGSAAFNHNLYLGYNTNSSGSYSLDGSASSLTVWGVESIGYSGTGSFQQTSGTNTVNGTLELGGNNGGIGSYTLAGGSVSASDRVMVGRFGTGQFLQTGGTIASPSLSVGTFNAGNSYTMSGGSATFGNVSVGDFFPGGAGVLSVSGSSAFAVSGQLYIANTPGTAVNLSGGTLTAAALDFEGGPTQLNWTAGRLHLTSSVTWDSSTATTSTGGALGASVTLGSGQTLAITGSETLGGSGPFALTLNSGSAHEVSGAITLATNGTLTANAGSTITFAGFTQAGGAVHGTLLNQTSFIYESGNFNGRLINEGSAAFNASFSAGNGLTNNGTVSPVPSAVTLSFNGAGLDNQGDIFLAGGTLTGAGPLANNAVLTGRGTLAGSGGFTNNGLVSVSGGTLTLANSGTNANNAQLDIPAGQQLRLTGANLANFGTIYMNGGTVSGSATLTNNNAGVISGHGSISNSLNNLGTLAVESGILNVPSGFNNSGEIYLAGGGATLSGSGAIINTGVVRGDGAVSKAVNNGAIGEIRAEAGKRIKFTAGSAGANFGLINLQGGTAEFTQGLTNALGGRIVGRGMLKVGSAGLTNYGNVALSSGIADVFGDVVNDTGSAAIGITVSGNADVTFWDDLTNAAGSLFRVSGDSSATFFGTFAGAGVSGTGNSYFEADITPGFSPATVDFGGNASLSDQARLVMELGGTDPGTRYGQLHVSRRLSLGGTLTVSLIDGFMPASGQAFDILDWGSLTGTFATLQLPALSGPLSWNTSQLYTAGVLGVGLAGDFNNNGMVDAADYVVWRKSLGTTYTQNDYNVWRAHFGDVAGTGTDATANAAVPEPTTLLLMALMVNGWNFRQKRRFWKC